MKTTLDEWEILQAVVQLGGFAPAAEQLNRSQSTISYAVPRQNAIRAQQGLCLRCREHFWPGVSGENEVLVGYGLLRRSVEVCGEGPSRVLLPPVVRAFFGN
jgi:hypothetical protein